MPLKIKITSHNIVEAAFMIVREKGFTGITARNVVSYIGCSVMPIPV